MSATAHLRLAWQAQRAGRTKLRDVMLTLAVAEGGPGEPWAERCRVKLAREREGHFFGKFASLAEALAHEEVRNAVSRLREKYPAARVEWQLLAGEAARGLFTGRDAPVSVLLQELLGPPAEADVRRDAAEPIRGPVSRAKATVAARGGGAFPGGHSVVDVSPMGVGLDPRDEVGGDWIGSGDESTSGYYLGVLFSIALLLASTRARSEPVRRAG